VSFFFFGKVYFINQWLVKTLIQYSSTLQCVLGAAFVALASSVLAMSLLSLLWEVRDVVVTTLKVCRPRPGRRGGRPRPGQLSRYSLLQLWHRFCTKVAPMAMGERGFGFAGHCQWLCVSAIHADLLGVARVPSAPRRWPRCGSRSCFLSKRPAGLAT
jgi:hypothetical protein